MKHKSIQAYDKIKYSSTNEQLVLIADWTFPFKLYIDALSEGLGASLHKFQSVNEKPCEVPVCLIQRQIKHTEAGYGETQMQCIFLVWALQKLHHYLYGCVFEVITDFDAIKLLFNMQAPNRHMLGWQIAIQKHTGNMTIVHKAGNIHKDSYGWSSWEFTNAPDNPACILQNAESQIPIEGINIT
ncbi:hypothetical protein O181_047782 [Austropuccinia psidii MF-1]|uniref:Reverse transcriptase RNase H-like domain-containing protein n=1 Tax=Austropuccinia psidii MF-1 TaxID=1389203 RepID=A0A9Q3DYI5_9BASI|nr:hypothetical protein [Austropuccinia psidii MF-1]